MSFPSQLDQKLLFFLVSHSDFHFKFRFQLYSKLEVHVCYELQSAFFVFFSRALYTTYINNLSCKACLMEHRFNVPKHQFKLCFVQTSRITFENLLTTGVIIGLGLAHGPPYLCLHK